MSKITNDGLTRSGTGCIALPIWQQWASKGYCDVTAETRAPATNKQANNQKELPLATRSISRQLHVCTCLFVSCGKLSKKLYIVNGIVYCFELLDQLAVMLFSRDVKSSRPTWPLCQNFRPRSIRPRPRSRPHAMLASFSQRLPSWPSSQSSKSRDLRYILLR